MTETNQPTRTRMARRPRLTLDQVDEQRAQYSRDRAALAREKLDSLRKELKGAHAVLDHDDEAVVAVAEWFVDQDWADAHAVAASSGMRKEEVDRACQKLAKMKFLRYRPFKAIGEHRYEIDLSALAAPRACFVLSRQEIKQMAERDSATRKTFSDEEQAAFAAAEERVVRFKSSAQEKAFLKEVKARKAALK